MKQIRKYRDFYNNIKYRTNVFEWYPFKENAKLLYVGDSAILESYFLQRFKCCTTSLSNLDTLILLLIILLSMANLIAWMIKKQHYVIYCIN